MLTSLSISNYALIDQLEMKPSSQLSMITGETGAGKSIMLGAVGLLLGNRADTKVLFHEDQKCVVEGTFAIQSYGLQTYFEELELDYEDTCIIRREISPNGKSRSFINDSPVLLESLKSLGSRLMDVHSQHDTLLLGEGEYQLDIIDAFAQAGTEKIKYQQSFTAFKKAKKNWEELHQQSLALKKEYDFLQFQLNELSSLSLVAGEQEEMESSQEILENAEEIKRKINEILHVYYEEQQGILQGLAQVQAILQGLERLAHPFKEYSRRFQEIRLELKDVMESLDNEDRLVEVDEEKLQLLRDRLSAIYRLQKKHGVQSVEELLVLESQFADKVFQVQHADENLDRAKKEYQDAEAVMLEAGRQWSEKRRSSFREFENAVIGLLRDLGIENASFQLQRQEMAPSLRGIDAIDMLFSANKGALPQSLKKVASGGEFSRLLFAIKYLMADKMALPTLIFDEIDMGISGEIALQLVRMMQEIAKRHQVICITHLPQVAAKGDTHYFVYKDNSSEKTVSKIKLLTPEERVQALAQMIAGANPSLAAQTSAQELLRN
jgi:DNA repair protein RecN (Recombination protein N)